ncbi:MAG: gamma-glutamyltransferase [Lewinellaceae bacterium]|nr:gamma-glutamyltransferase [Phaeodactylibacter sp.]MCB0613666.1 gamma-glutamyltransferase [Phaeodactylibacter sp.]MCB9349167.1 gamma-glutamyltransferase [Lewinellaceae bacterium]
MKPCLVPLVFIVLFLSASCKRATPGPDYQATKVVTADSAAVVSPHPLATQVGLGVLKKGGNAIDAAVAVQFALAVVYPRAGNIGGGGFMVIRTKDGQAAALDYREKAPLAADRDMYLDSLGNVIDGLSTMGHLAAGVPGTVAGLFEAHKKYGRIRDMKELVQPAIELAERGFRISPTEARRLNGFQEGFRKYNEEPNPFIKDSFQLGDLLVQKRLAETLKQIRDKGAAGFYEGPVAEAIIAEIQSGNGLITMEDLHKYEAKWREPVIGQYDGYRIISMPPSSSGGIALLQMLKMVAPYPLNEYGFHSTRAVHLMVEAERRAYADRAEHLGDSDFYDVPVDSMLSDAYLQARMASFDAAHATVSDSILAGNFKLLKESFETTHTSVVDAEGNAVSVTTTLNSNYGCKVWVDGAGFFLNNEMDDFSAKPGVPNQFGLVGAEANSIRPEKRMLSSMTPTIVEKEGKLFMVLGAPGGSTIITAVFQVFINVAEFGMGLEEAVNAGRFHHQWLPDAILIEDNAFPDSTKQALEAMGHSFNTVGRMAVIKAIVRLPDGRLQGVGDPRNPDDDAGGY